MSVHELDVALLVGALVLLLAIAAVRLSVGTGLPSLLLYVGLGLLLGEDGPGNIEFDDAGLARVLGYAALVVILTEGGLTTPWPHIRGVLAPAAVLATVGVGVSMVVTAAAAVVLLDVDWRFALLVGAVVSSTDAAAVFSVLRRVPLPPRVAALLEAESGFNDAPVVILVVALSSATDVSSAHLFGLLVLELAVGGVVGFAVGKWGAIVMRRIALPASGLYPIAVLAHATAAYGAAAVLHGSGFLAVYIAALVLGNSRLPHGPATRGFIEGLGWLAQIGLFVLLGLLVTPSRLGDAILPALGIGVALLLLGRPLSVLVSLTPFRLPWREQAFVSWAGLRGAVPIVMATVPVVEGVRRSDLLFDLVFVLVVLLTLLQGRALPRVAQALGLGGGGAPHELDVESSPLSSLGADLLQLRVPADSRLHGVEVFELRLPREAAITLVVRDGQAFVPNPQTMLQAGDELLLVATGAAREETERRLRAVSRDGRLADWRERPQSGTGVRRRTGGGRSG